MPPDLDDPGWSIGPENHHSSLDLEQKAEIRVPMRAALVFLTALFLLQAHAQDEPCGTSLLAELPTCPGDDDGSLSVTGGNGATFTYTWFHDLTVTTATASDLVAGFYSVLVNGDDGCAELLEFELEDPDVAPLGSMVTTDISCAGANDGSVTFTVNPGPYTWQWIDDPGETSTTLTDLGPGTYTVLVSGGPCPSFVSGFLGDPDITIIGEADYCPSEPPVLTTNLEWGFSPHVYLWSTGETTSSINITPGTEGLIEVTAIDTVIGCIASGEITLTELESPVVAFAAPDSLCIRVPGVAVVTQSNADSLVWRWDDDGFSNLPEPTITFDEPLWQPITLQGFDAFGCGSVPLLDSVYVRARLPADFSVEQVPCTPFVDLNFNSTSDSCAFFVGDSLILDVCSGLVRYDMRKYLTYDYTFYSTQPNQCDDTSSVSIDVRTEPTLFLPTAFTPDGDGINDEWPGPVEIPETGFELEIYDRWGSAHWRSTDTQLKWDGSQLPIGVYVYTMRMRDPCEPTKEITNKGFVTLVR